MKRMIAAFIATLMLAVSLVGEASAQPATPPAIRIAQPAQGQVMSNRVFPLLYVLEGDVLGAGLDHVHWQINDGPKPTAPDLSGVDDITVESDGVFHLSVWMADKDHNVVGEKASVDFRVVTFGAVTLAPLEGEKVASSSLSVYYGTFGSSPASAVMTLQLDEQAPIADPDGDGYVLYHGVGNGAHKLKLWLADAAGTRVSEISERLFSVESALSAENIGELKRLIVGASRSGTPGGRKRGLAQARRLLIEMRDGGKFAADQPSFTHAAVTRLTRLLAAASKGGKEELAALVRRVSRMGR